uniref:Fibronectin type-III domain-containing protein n=1 Tax=Electrophorus electricus TaxID=8005 RepID=A0AAY5EE10_ELEEL
MALLRVFNPWLSPGSVLSAAVRGGKVILVQVNPGETFTIRREDGTLQCIQGPAEVPMMSPNGSIPPIHVPPGYISQVTQERWNEALRSAGPCHSHNEMGFHPPVQIEPECCPTIRWHGDGSVKNMVMEACFPGRSAEILYNMTFLGREEHCKPPPKKLKERIGERQGLSRVTTPPSSTYKSGPQCSATPNGYGKGHASAVATSPGGGASGGSPGTKRAERKARGSPKHTDGEQQGERAPPPPQSAVSKIQARSALVSWARAPRAGASGRGQADGAPPTCSYELLLADKGSDGKYRVVYSGEELQYTLTDLRPATDYHVRVSAACNSVKGPDSEARTFTTHSAPPDIPLPPRLSHRTKSSLTLQWKPPVDNGSKITSYILEWDEGKKNGVFRECYFGHQRHFKVMRLCPAVGYTFRVAALNDIGPSRFSTEMVFHTTGSLPQMSVAPRLLRAGPSWLVLEWTRPSSCSPEEEPVYMLEMQDESKVKCVCVCVCVCVRTEAPTDCLFDCCCAAIGQWEVAYRGPLREHVCDGLRAATLYSVRVSAIGTGGHSVGRLTVNVFTRGMVHFLCNYRCHFSFSPFSPLLCFTPLLFPALTLSLTLSLSHSFPPSLEACDGENESLLYSVEMRGPEQEEDDVTQVYHGTQTECTVASLLPGATYRFRVCAANDAGNGPYSDFLEVTTAAGPPGQCAAPVVSLTSHTCAVVSWEVSGASCSGADISGYRLSWGQDQDSLELVYSGTDTSYEVSDLEAAVSFCCRLQAVNQVGASPYSEPVWCRTPAAPPDAVAGLRVREAAPSPDRSEPFSPSTCLALAWDEPRCNGQEISHYTIAVGDDHVASSTTCHVIRELQPDTEYSVQVRAENAAGAGPFGPCLRVRTRPLPPPAPRLECAAVGPQSLRLRWGESGKGPLTNQVTYILQMEDRNQRFVPIYRGPSRTYRVQRLSESSRYTFRIQAVSEAGEGLFSETCSFSTTKSVPPTLKAPRVAQLEGNTCEVTWENVPPMRGDRISYVLQVLGGRESEYRQVYKGEDTTFQLSGLQWNSDYRIRVLACRRCLDTSQELCGSFSPSTYFSPRRSPSASAGGAAVAGAASTRGLTDEQFASLIVLGVASFSIFIAYLLQLLI